MSTQMPASKGRRGMAIGALALGLILATVQPAWAVNYKAGAIRFARKMSGLPIPLASGITPTIVKPSRW